jgi:hypothetical protein
VKPGMGNFGTFPWALWRSKKFDLNGNELAITSSSDINKYIHIYMLKKIYHDF